MKNIVFPIITDLELNMPIFLVSVGCNYTQDHIIRENGHPYALWIQCISGVGELIIYNKKFTIQKNQGILIPANVPHEYYSIQDNWTVSWVEMGGFSIDQIFKHLESLNMPVLTIFRPDATIQTINNILYMSLSNGVVRSFECSKLVYQLIMDISELIYLSKNETNMNRYTRLQPIFDFIDENYNKVITLDELSEILDITPQYLCSIFKKVTGIRIYEYINNIRIKNSKEIILKYQDKPIKEIAELCGYDSMSYFCEVFKKIEKITPGEFRKMYGL